MTGFDPTAPARDTDNDAPEDKRDNVVPAEDLTPDNVPASGGDDPSDDRSTADHEK